MSAFDSCIKLKNVTFPNDSKLETIGKHAFNGSSIEKIVIPDKITTFCDGIFNGCSNLALIFSLLKNSQCFVVPSSVKKIDNKAFIFSRGLAVIEFEDNSEIGVIDLSWFRYSPKLVIMIPFNSKKISVKK